MPVTILSEHRCHLGEGANYDAATDTAWWFDILERRLFEANLGTGAVASHALPVMASALAMIDDNHQLLAAEDGLHIRTIADGRMTPHTPIEADRPTRSNDARVHPCGTLWTSTMGLNAEPRAGAIYALHRGVLTKLFTGITIPNAICFSPDGTTGYFADSQTNILLRVTLDPATGLPTAAPSALHVHRGDGVLDGAVVDADGLIWCAHWGGGCISVYTPDGAQVRTLRVPARQPSCPVFAGPGFDRLLVTTAWEGMDAAARAGDPGHGRTFLLNPGTRGRPEPRVML
ncbi:MAG: SMP-30/gluconolactonase/LRE family protein [Tardiphaga sp.]